MPTNTALDAPSNNTFYVMIVSNADTCTGVYPSSDISGTATIWINPRPKADVALVTYPTNCSYNVSNTTIRATLHGISPWHVTWSDGTTQSVSVAYADYPSANLTNIYADTATNFTLQVTNLTDAHCDALPGDLNGSGSVTILPTPSAVVSGTNTICNGQPPGVLAVLHGIGGPPGRTWSLSWSDGTPQINTTNPAYYPRLLVNLYPDVATNYTLWVTNLYDNAFGCQTSSTNYLLGRATVIVNPRPTATLAPLVTTNCNVGSNYTLTVTLHGLGPWSVWWNDGTNQVYDVATNGPVDITRIVYPTNTPGSSAPAQNIYYITSVSNTVDNCQGNLAGDIMGTNIIWVDPLPTATLAIGTNDFSCSADGTNLLVSVSQTGTNVQVRARFSYAVTNYSGGSGNIKSITNVTLAGATLYVTNHATFTGIPDWTAVWQAAAHDPAGNPTGTLNSTNTYAPTNATFVWAVGISNSTPGTNFTFSITNLTDQHCTASAAGLPAGIHVVVNGTPSAYVYLAGNGTVCSGYPAAILVDLGGQPPWTLLWNDGGSNYVNTTPYTRLVTNNVANNPASFSYWITNLTDGLMRTTSSSNDLTGGATITVDPVPAYPPEPVGTNYYITCTNVQLTLAVAVSNGFTAFWYADSNRTDLLLPRSTTFVTPTTNVNTTNYYFAAAVFDDTNYTACASTNLTQFTLVFYGCPTNFTITYSGTNSGALTWYGNYVLESATNLAPPIIWTPIWTGSVANNTQYWSIPPPVQFFRLYAPTN